MLRSFAVYAAQDDGLRGGETMRKLIFGLVTWVSAVTAAHMALNVNWSVIMNDRLPLDKRKLNVAYIPVT
jgi:hypothetical protein